MMGVRATEPFELLLLEHAQELRLQRRGDVADLIEEERAFVCQLESPDLLRDSAGERAFLVAEQLAFKQVEWNGGTIQLDERAPASGTEGVNRARDELLARAGLSLDENSGIRRGDTLDQGKYGFKRRASADDLLEANVSATRVIVSGSFESSHGDLLLPQASRSRSTV